MPTSASPDPTLPSWSPKSSPHPDLEVALDPFGPLVHRAGAELRHQAYKKGFRSLLEKLNDMEERVEKHRNDMEKRVEKHRNDIMARVEKEIEVVKKDRIADLRMAQQFIKTRAEAEYHFLASESIIRLIQSRNDFSMRQLESHSPNHAEVLRNSNWNWIMKWIDEAQDKKIPSDQAQLRDACKAARSELAPHEIPFVIDLHSCLKLYRCERNLTAHPIPTLSTARRLVEKAITDAFPKRTKEQVQKVIDYAHGLINQEPGRKATKEDFKKCIPLMSNGLVPLFEKDSHDSEGIGPASAMATELDRRIKQAEDAIGSHGKKRNCDELEVSGYDDEREPKRTNTVGM
ncbi:hypothetical protein K435DRAFT_835547 [Dendrothele bispora CBS 962.96]|uniref:Uncharacterized protein n=1 Tax=Dendrothele bispora (strain CBS 962.96) TaxID=1314807 RepID=A0A4S8MM22_DENBC|nr:hypothetical protein K435DRAFT_835547 [Dendrothele bispora CBS 962.96]